MSKLHALHDEYGQSPWLDNLTRPYVLDGTLARLVADGIRGVTANPTIFAKAIEGSTAYDDQFALLIRKRSSVVDAYWDLVMDDIRSAAEILRPTFDSSAGRDGFVSIEVAPELAHDVDGTITAARWLHEQIELPNVLVKIPATAEGVKAIETMVAEGRSINVTLIFSLERYGEVIDAYLSGLEAAAASGIDLSSVHGVASFFISRVDTEVDRRLDAIGTTAARALRGEAAIAQGCVAYETFTRRFSDERWGRLAAEGATVQRPLWASTSTKDPAFRDTRYVESLIGPDTVNTLPEPTIEAFEDHGVLARTIDADTQGAHDVLRGLTALEIDMSDVAHTLEEAGVASFGQSFSHVLGALEAKVGSIGPQ